MTWQVFRPDVCQVRSVGTRDTSTSLAYSRSCTCKYFTFTCRVLLDKPCLCASDLAALASHRRSILALMPRSFRIAFTNSPSAHPATSALNSPSPLLCACVSCSCPFIPMMKPSILVNTDDVDFIDFAPPAQSASVYTSIVATSSVFRSLSCVG